LGIVFNLIKSCFIVTLNEFKWALKYKNLEWNLTKIDQIILVRNNGVQVQSFPTRTPLQDDERQALIGGMLKAIDAFSEELFSEKLYSYETATHRVTLLSLNTHFLGIFSDRTSFQQVPQIIQDYLSKPPINEAQLADFEARLNWLFWPQLDTPYHKHGLILTVGRRITPVFLAISRHAPKVIALITSDDTKPIALQLTKFFGFQLEENAKLFICDQNNTTAITNAGLEALQFFTQHHIATEEWAVNATGGTKGMTIAIAHISYLKNIPVFYVKSDMAQRQNLDQIFGDEKIAYLDNPADSVGLYLEDVAKTAFNHHQFLKASDTFNRLRSVFDANKRSIFQALKELALAYAEWDLFNFKPALHHLRTTLKLLKPNLHSNYGNQYKPLWDKLQPQINLLEKLQLIGKTNIQQYSTEMCLILYFELLNNAQRRLAEQKFDDAISRYYRFLEATAQLLLWKHYQIDTANFNKTATKVAPIARTIFRQKQPITPFLTLNILTWLFQTPSLPPTISLAKSWQLLDLLDPKIHQTHFLSKLKNALPIRNYSILAHGWNPVKSTAAQTFINLIHCCLQFIQNSFQEILITLPPLPDTLKFVTL